MNTNTIKETEIIGLELTRKLLLLDHSQSQQDEEGRSTRTTTPRFTHEALQAASFLLERFVSEARQRAKLEAEFEYDKLQYNDNNNHHSNENAMGKNPMGGTKDGSKRLNFNTTTSSSQTSNIEDSLVEIQSEHVLKIAAELLLDFC